MDIGEGTHGEPNWKDELIDTLIERVNKEICFLKEEIRYLREESKMKNKILNAVMDSGLFTRTSPTKINIVDEMHPIKEKNILREKETLVKEVRINDTKIQNDSHNSSLPFLLDIEKTNKPKEVDERHHLQYESLKDHLNLPMNSEIGKKDEKWPKGTICILGNSIVSDLETQLLHGNKRSLPATHVDELFDYVKPIITNNPSVIILDVGTNELVSFL